MSRFPRPPSVEPLSDLAWRRIENGLFEELALDAGLPKTRTLALQERRRVWPAAATLAACVAALVVYFASSPNERADDPMQSSRIVTAESPSEVSVGDARLVVDANSAILVTTQSDRVEVVLERGTVDCKVAKRDQRPPFVVRVGAVLVEVVGTEFSVTRRGDSAEVEVFEGVVKVLADGERHRVHAGERWPATGDDATASDEALAASDDTASDDTASAPSRSQHTPRRQRAQRRQRPARDHRPAADRVADTQPVQPSPRERYEDAARLESSDPAAAIAIYRELAVDGGAWAANALYAQGRLELDRGRERAARRLLGRYLKRYPDGANAADARTLLQNLQ